MPEWISVWIAKIFGSEPVVKVMYVLIGWALLILLIPPSFAAAIYEKSNIPFSGQLCLFALAFIIVDGLHRVIKWFESRRCSAVNNLKLTQEADEKARLISRVIEQLDEGEKERLFKYFELKENTLWFFPSDVYVTSLSQKGVIICAHNHRRTDGRLQMTYRINDIYIEAARECFQKSNAL
ncbi:super-infection exclusion protein B [Enterobacter sp. 22503]|uniref:super-infection exclusion protein B n=1 Tax=unclassified Enterobacter TaxID=2608935 RepID=UPI003F87F4A8